MVCLQNRRPDYITTFVEELINWDKVRQKVCLAFAYFNLQRGLLTLQDSASVSQHESQYLDTYLINIEPTLGGGLHRCLSALLLHEPGNRSTDISSMSCTAAHIFMDKQLLNGSRLNVAS